MITTALTHIFQLLHPIVLAPMGGVSGGRLAAAVSNAGGLGLVGGGYGDRAWLRTELDLMQKLTVRPWGVGFITWSIDKETLDVALEYRPTALMLSFGDPGRYASAIKGAGCKLICQVQDVEGARLAKDAGADVIVAQGTEAGGHGASRSTLPLVPAVVDAVAPTPVVAAGGIADGRGLAAALCLGAQGALLGTRFCATPEALGSGVMKRRIVEARGEQTIRTQVFDIVRGIEWPAIYPGRALSNDFTARWNGREDDLTRSLGTERGVYSTAVRETDHDTAVVWAGEVVDLIESVEAAAALVQQISIEAEWQLRRSASLMASSAISPDALH
jgi:nitronate monooxygenase